MMDDQNSNVKLLINNLFALIQSTLKNLNFFILHCEYFKAIMKVLFFIAVISVGIVGGLGKLNCPMAVKSQLCSRFYLHQDNCADTLEVVYRDKLVCNKANLKKCVKVWKNCLSEIFPSVTPTTTTLKKPTNNTLKPTTNSLKPTTTALKPTKHTTITLKKPTTTTVKPITTTLKSRKHTTITLKKPTTTTVKPTTTTLKSTKPTTTKPSKPIKPAKPTKPTKINVRPTTKQHNFLPKPSPIHQLPNVLDPTFFKIPFGFLLNSTSAPYIPKNFLENWTTPTITTISTQTPNITPTPTTRTTQTPRTTPSTPRTTRTTQTPKTTPSTPTQTTRTTQTPRTTRSTPRTTRTTQTPKTTPANETHTLIALWIGFSSVCFICFVLIGFFIWRYTCFNKDERIEPETNTPSDVENPPDITGPIQSIPNYLNPIHSNPIQPDFDNLLIQLQTLKHDITHELEKMQKPQNEAAVPPQKNVNITNSKINIFKFRDYNAAPPSTSLQAESLEGVQSGSPNFPKKVSFNYSNEYPNLNRFFPGSLKSPETRKKCQGVLKRSSSFATPSASVATSASASQSTSASPSIFASPSTSASPSIFASPSTSATPPTSASPSTSVTPSATLSTAVVSEKSKSEVQPSTKKTIVPDLSWMSETLQDIEKDVLQVDSVSRMSETLQDIEKDVLQVDSESICSMDSNNPFKE